jgi:curved DNA-binding protein CbpA
MTGERKRKNHATNNCTVSPPPPPPPPDGKTTVNNIEQYARDKLQQISNAHEILSNDQTRLLYHRYGIQNGIEGAIQLLTGKMYTGDSTTGSNEQSRLLQLMGHPPHLAHDAKEARIYYLTATIVEKLRPLVEGTVSQDMYAQSIYDECVALSKSALGKQILRCVGRAYRREGYRVLRTMNRNRQSSYGGSLAAQQHSHQHDITDVLHDSWNNVKHFASAAFASGKLALVEAKLRRLQSEQERSRKKMKESRLVATKGGKGTEISRTGISHDNLLDDVLIGNIGILPDESEDESIDDIGSMFSDDEGNVHEELDGAHFEYVANEKTYNALLTAHQTEVLWKLTKIDLDSTIREACRRMLMAVPGTDNGGRYAFFPSESSPYPQDWNHHPDFKYHARYHQPQDGWVGQNGNTIDTEVGRLRAGAALVLVGDLMVRCGKGLE